MKSMNDQDVERLKIGEVVDNLMIPKSRCENVKESGQKKWLHTLSEFLAAKYITDQKNNLIQVILRGLTSGIIMPTNGVKVGMSL